MAGRPRRGLGSRPTRRNQGPDTRSDSDCSYHYESKDSSSDEGKESRIVPRRRTRQTLTPPVQEISSDSEDVVPAKRPPKRLNRSSVEQGSTALPKHHKGAQFGPCMGMTRAYEDHDTGEIIPPRPCKLRASGSDGLCRYHTKDILRRQGGKLFMGDEHGALALDPAVRQAAIDSVHEIDPDTISEHPAGITTSAEIPQGLLMPLLPFQRESLWWMKEQEERSDFRGGILADEMGMGKTIQTISLIVARRAPKLADMPLPMRDDIVPVASGNGIAELHVLKCRATLVVCPSVALIQWKNEIIRFSEPGALKIFVYHGKAREFITLEDLSMYDVVLTTYSILENEYRRQRAADKVSCEFCRKRFYPDKLIVHQRYFCGPNSSQDHRSAAQRKTVRKAKGKLEEKRNAPSKIKQKAKGKQKLLAKDEEDASEIEWDESDDDMDGNGIVNEEVIPQSSRLHKVMWYRVVLDEAHAIKDRRSSTAISVFDIQCRYRWALTGTPLQNRVGELFSLVRFLRADPYAYYGCQKCDCKSLDWRMNRDADSRKCNCGHSPLVHFSWMNRHIANPIKREGYVREGKVAMLVLKRLLNRIMLRRTKKGRADELSLPPQEVIIHRLSFDEREEDYYTALFTQSTSTFNHFVDANTVLNNFAHVFELLMRLRQAVNHPWLVVFNGASSDNEFGSESRYVGLCKLCGLECTQAGVSATTCGCIFCTECIQNYTLRNESDNAVGCPACFRPLGIGLLGAQQPSRRKSIMARIRAGGGEFQSSTKIEGLVEQLQLMRAADPTAKALVFSQFTSMLDIIEYRLQRAGIYCVKLDGRHTPEQRDRLVQAFNTQGDIVVFLLSLKAGGVALNLTAANHAFLMDVWWNEAVEKQARDRCHRLGQYKAPVTVHRMIVSGTIEDRILALQDKKNAVCEGTVGNDSSALSRLTEEDLRFLFSS